MQHLPLLHLANYLHNYYFISHVKTIITYVYIYAKLKLVLKNWITLKILRVNHLLFLFELYVNVFRNSFSIVYVLYEV